VRDTEIDTFEKHIQHLIAAIPTDGTIADMQKLFASFTLDITTELFLGTSTNLLTTPSSSLEGNEQQQFAAAFDYAQRAISGIEDYSISSFCRKLLFGDRKLQESLKCIHSFVDKVIENATSSHSAKKSTECDKDKNIFETLLEQGRSKEDLKIDVINLVLAGRDTMAAYLSSIWYSVSQRADVFDKLRREIKELNGQRPSKDDLSKYSYLKMTMQEGKPFCTCLYGAANPFAL
jgi:cytochrome P450